ncbi:MAG: DUF1376 domain-containing protein [Rickettsiales bacterium]|nr:DUF1376 domain-containing protein [Rickettsiales bacterium]
MGKIPMQQWYLDAHISDTGTLTLEEQGAYRLLMDHLWIKGGHLPDNDKDVARLLRIPVKKWQKIKVRLSDYLLIYEGVITQKRLQKDYQSAIKKSAINAQNGGKGGRKTAENWKSTQANAVAKDGAVGGARRRTNGSGRHISDVLDQLELDP